MSPVELVQGRADAPVLLTCEHASQDLPAGWRWPEADRRLATLREGNVLEWSGAEEWHADPLGGRVPCFHRFGWAVLARLRAAGFREAQLCRVDAPGEALFGLWVIRARR